MSARDEFDQLRVPPHSTEAEQSLLGGLLLDNRAYDLIGDIVTPADFYDARHATTFTAIASEIVANRPADVITVFERLQRLGQADDCGGLVYLNSLAQSVPSAANIRRYASIVRGHSVRRALIATADRAMTLAWEQGDTAAVLDAITSMFGELQGRQVRKAPRAIADIAIERIDHYTDLAEGKVVAGWPTHIPSLDRYLGGGLRPGDLGILAARPGGGKTSFAQSIAQALAGDARPTLFLSMEMSESEIADRAVSSSGRVSYSALLGGRMQDEDWSRASDAMERLARLPLYIDDQGGLTLRDVRVKAKSVKGLQVLVVDYLQLASGARRDGNRNAEIEELTRGLKALAKELGVAILALSQLNRDVEKRASRRPTLSDLRDSGAIEQDADFVAFLWPIRELEGEGRRIIGLGLDKNRRGRTGEFGLDFFGDIQRWGESTADIRPVVGKRDGDFE